VRTISAYTGRSGASIGRDDLDRWEQRGFEGLLDGRAPGNPPRITEEARTFMEGKPSEERTPGMPPDSPRPSERASGRRSPPKPSADTSARRAIAGSAPAMCE
jgi:hypothetical protein